ncbi:carboxymuconolactone decarboxylase family protein [Novosphingobium taihuense]|uniref:Alkylhydroperoxidase family enzyme n=1 Tax=Novosphingobium taihuense TaxID=260085 RepID=A0A7W7AD74_9SPHN|nr:carboxymuconolactone decarboxylase family protein [Novosphingobium taihuense]MBB4613962.1 alkylhydroperoxidase family enzyme [Novosphingobium taihuense]TWH86813.1 alkylhydroperoxidase family enzyme [Novosphingobium taihuense]
MARIAIPDDEQANPYGYAARNHAVPIMAAGAAFSEAVYRESRLSLREFEGARMRTAQINGCMICRDFRAQRDVPKIYGDADEANRLVTANGPGPDEDFYGAVSAWRTSGLFSERERLAIEFAERFGTEPQALASDENFWAMMHGAFSDGEIVDLAHCTAAWAGLGRVAHVLGFDTVCLAGLGPEKEAA